MGIDNGPNITDEDFAPIGEMLGTTKCDYETVGKKFRLAEPTTGRVVGNVQVSKGAQEKLKNKKSKVTRDRVIVGAMIVVAIFAGTHFIGRVQNAIDQVKTIIESNEVDTKDLSPYLLQYANGTVIEEYKTMLEDKIRSNADSRLDRGYNNVTYVNANYGDVVNDYYSAIASVNKAKKNITDFGVSIGFYGEWNTDYIELLSSHIKSVNPDYFDKYHELLRDFRTAQATLANAKNSIEAEGRINGFYADFIVVYNTDGTIAGVSLPQYGDEAIGRGGLH